MVALGVRLLSTVSRQCMIKKYKNVFQVDDYLYECMNEK